MGKSFDHGSRCPVSLLYGSIEAQDFSEWRGKMIINVSLGHVLAVIL